MKNICYVFLFLLLSCTQDKKEESLNYDAIISFSPSLGVFTRSGNNTWQDGDMFGISMISESGEGIIKNAQYSMIGTTLLPANKSEELKFPADQRVDFIAYYPYSKTAIENYTIDLVNQNDKQNDVLFSNNATNCTSLSNPISLVFNHVCSKIVMNLNAKKEILDNLEIKMAGINTTAQLVLGSGTITNQGTPSEVKAIISNSKAELIMLPGTVERSRVVFRLGNEAWKDVPFPLEELISGKEYIFNVNISRDKVEFGNMSISDWIEENMDDMAISLQELDSFAPDPREVPLTLDGMKLIWHDEFNDVANTGPNPEYWSFESGFVRNEELQWYQEKNAICDGSGALVIEGHMEKVPNPKYKPGSSSWKEKREYAEYTSSSIITRNKFSYKYGRMLCRAKIPTQMGAWPAIWTLGEQYPWPSCGELDVMEYYLLNKKTASIFANACWGSDKQWIGKWKTFSRPLAQYTTQDPDWSSKYHIWRTDWNENSIKIYLDDVLLNEIDLSETINGNWGQEGAGKNPFRQPHYILLNLALGANGGIPAISQFPLKYYIDYVRVYQ